MNKPIYQHHEYGLLGCMYKDKYGYYYYRIYMLIDGKYKSVAQSYANLVDRELCLEKMKDDMSIIDSIDVAINHRDIQSKIDEVKNEKSILFGL